MDDGGYMRSLEMDILEVREVPEFQSLDCVAVK